MKAHLFICLALACTLTTACAGRNKNADPTGLAPGMPKSQVIEIMGNPSTIKPAGPGKEIFIYREQTELIHVFLVKGRIKSIEHIRRRPPTIGR